MKRNKLLHAFSLADEKYVAEADPTKEKKAKTSLIRKCVLAACLCLIMTACNIVLFTPYDTTPPDVSRYSDSEYYPVIEKLNALTYKKPKFKNNFEYLTNELSGAFLSAKGEAMDDMIMEDAVNSDTTGVPMDGTAGIPKDAGESYEEITDNQVKDVTESDRIKRSDKFIFYLDGMIIKSFEIGDGPLTLIDTLDLTVTGNASVNQIEFYLSKDCRTITAVIPYYDYTSGGDSATKIQTVSVSEAGELGTGNFITVDGYYKTSRLIDGKFIFVSQLFLNKNSIDFNVQSTYIPTVSVNGGEKTPIAPECITVPDRIDNSAYTVIYKMDASTLEIEGQSALLSYTEELYVTKENAYVTRGYTKSETDGYYRVTQRMTDIVCISLADGFENKGEISVAGYINDRYSIDEYNGILRVVTTTDVSAYKEYSFGDNTALEVVTDGASGTSASLYCISLDTWEVVAGVYQFAPVGENVRSVRYDGNMAYVCTAIQRKDPVFFFDLTDLNNIICKDTGEIEGFSTSLVNFEEGYLLGIGQGANGGVKIEIYRETEAGVESVAAFERDGSYTSGYYKSYYIDRKNQLIGIGISGYMVDERGVYSRYNNYLVLHFNRDALELEIAAELPLEGSVELMRGVYIDGYFHMFGSNDFKTSKLK